MKTKFVIALSLVFNVLLAQHKNPTFLYDPGAAPRDHNLNFERMRLYVEFEPVVGLVKGKITHFFSPIRQKVDTFYLDGPGIKIKEAKLNGKEVKYRSDANGITFYPEKALLLGEKDSLAITYEATPRKGIYFIGWNDEKNISRKQIWTQGQGVDNRHWFPCYDTPNDKLITEVYVKFDKAYKVLSNGVKVAEKELKDGTKLWHYKMSHPHQTYLVMLGIGKYEIKETRSKSGVPLRQWYYPEWKDRYEYTYKYNEKIFDFLESEIGVPYGWESYSQIPVQDFMFGAMENTSATLFGDFFEVDARSFNDRNYVSVNAHELAHQWFGDYVSARSGNSHWLQESFATHYNVIAERECFGEDHFNWARRYAHQTAINTMDKKPIAHSETPTSIIYQKGSQVLEMLKYVTGREGYNRSVKRYLLDHSYANVDSDDLLNAFQDELGMDLDWFWNEWVYRGGEPAYKVTYSETEITGKYMTQFTVNQVHQQNDVIGLFKMPMVFEVHYTDGSVDSRTEWIEKESHLINIPNPSKKAIAYVLFDPNSAVMKTVTFNKPFEMLKVQSLKAAHMLDRYDAVFAMRSLPIDQKRNALIEAFQKNNFHAVKTEVVIQLIDDKNPESIALVKAALMDKDVQVRKGVIMNAKQIEKSLLPEYEKLLTDSSYQTIATALEKLCFQYPENIAKYLDRTKDIEGTNGRNVRVKWLEIAAATQIADSKKHIDQLIEYTSNSYEFITRANAMAALKRLNYFDVNVLLNCMQAAVSNNGRLAGPANETIKYFYAQDKHKAMITETITNKKMQNWEKEILNRLLQ
ncbi:MAG: M1 family metallopeptidase [Sphingobacteriaceae bacterium]